MDKAVARFWDKVVRDPETACWEWTASRNSRGYGTFRAGFAHRFAYELLVEPIPAGHEIHHQCHNQGCCNPDHLEALAGSEHEQLHLKTHCAQGHPFDVANTIIISGFRRCRICKARAFADWQKRNTEKVNTYHREHYAKNRESILAKRRAKRKGESVR